MEASVERMFEEKYRSIIKNENKKQQNTLYVITTARYCTKKLSVQVSKDDEITENAGDRHGVSGKA